MPITQTQRQLRQRHIGSSDSAAILGLDPWRTVHDVYVEKTLDHETFADNDAITVGNYVEDGILRWMADQLGERIIRNQRRVAGDGIHAANHDALFDGKPWGAEAKSTSVADDYGAELTDEVPERVMVQCQHQMYVSNLELVWVPVLLVNFGMRLRLYKVPRSETIIDAIREENTRFWQEHVVPGVPPADFAPCLNTLKRVVRVPNKTVVVDTSIMRNYLEVNEEYRELGKRLDAEKAVLLAALGDAEAGDAGHLGTITYLEQNSPPRYDRKAMAADGVFDKYATVGTHRVLRFKPVKEKP